MYTNSLRFPGPVRRLGSSDYQADRRGREPVKPCQVFLKLEMQPGWPEILRRSQLSAYLPVTHGAAREESGTCNSVEARVLLQRRESPLTEYCAE